jgi:hypothetical protein
VDSHPDPPIHKARIAIQIQPSECQSAWSGRAFNRYGNCIFNFYRPDACLSWSGRVLIRYRNCVLKINRLDNSTSPSGCGSQTGKIFSENLRNTGHTVARPDGPSRIFYCSRIFEPQPINRGPWALTTARIQY